MSDENVILKKVLEMADDVASILENMKAIRQDNINLNKRVKNNTKSISKLYKIISEHEKNIEQFDTDISSIKSSINKFDKLDYKLFRVKRFITFIAFDNKYARLALSGLIWFILIAGALIILYNLIFLFNIDKKTVEDIIDIIK